MVSARLETVWFAGASVPYVLIVTTGRHAGLGEPVPGSRGLYRSIQNNDISNERIVVKYSIQE